MTEKAKEKAIRVALEKLRLEAERVSPEIRRSKTEWNPVLLRKVAEVELRAEERSMLVRMDEDTGETLGWRYQDVDVGSDMVSITKEEALETAEKEVEVPDDAELRKAELLERGSAGYTYTVEWRHVVEGLEVENDFIIVKINPGTGRVVSVTKNWSEV